MIFSLVFKASCEEGLELGFLLKVEFGFNLHRLFLDGLFLPRRLVESVVTALRVVATPFMTSQNECIGTRSLK